MKIRYKLIVAFIAVLSLTSCNDWLEVLPKGQVQGEELLKDEKGYNAALDGVYYKLTSNTLYGTDLSFGMMDVLAQYHDLSASVDHPYYRQYLFDYKDINSKTRFEIIWSKMYEAIAQVNYILRSLEENRSQVTHADLIEGEAHALRAFIHMELASMFGPVIQTTGDLDKACISYRSEFNIVAQEFESMRSVLTKAKKDLTKAAEFLKNDPIIENGRQGNGNTSVLTYHSVLERRGDRMNLYAVKGLLMRIETALLNKTEAYRLAKELIDECKATRLFTLTNKTTELYNANMGEEMLLGFYKNDLWQVTKGMFGLEEGPTNRNLCISLKGYNLFVNELYTREPDGSGTDNRLRFWFKKNTTEIEFYQFRKFVETHNPGALYLPYYPEVSILRLAEVYYTACEMMIGVDNMLALEYLNEIRESRNLFKLTGTYDDATLMDYLMRDMRKDFIGEGRIWHIYKRRYRDFYVQQGVLIAPTEDKYVFPIPDNEYEFSPNSKPKK